MESPTLSAHGCESFKTETWLFISMALAGRRGGAERSAPSARRHRQRISAAGRQTRTDARGNTASATLPIKKTHFYLPMPSKVRSAECNRNLRLSSKLLSKKRPGNDFARESRWDPDVLERRKQGKGNNRLDPCVEGHRLCRRVAMLAGAAALGQAVAAQGAPEPRRPQLDWRVTSAIARCSPPCPPRPTAPSIGCGIRAMAWPVYARTHSRRTFQTADSDVWKQVAETAAVPPSRLPMRRRQIVPSRVRLRGTCFRLIQPSPTTRSGPTTAAIPGPISRRTKTPPSSARPCRISPFPRLTPMK